MPELPEVEAIRLSLTDLIDARLTSLTLHRHSLRYPITPGLDVWLPGQILKSLQRQGKVLIWHFETHVMLIHFGMSGILRKQEARIKHDHIDFSFRKEQRDHFLTYHDPRRFGFVLCSSYLKELQSFLPSGLDPLLASLRATDIVKAAQGRSLSMKSFLINQDIIAGIGNIYASEILWQCALSPFRACHTLNLAQAQQLIDAMQNILKRAIKANGTTLKDYQNAEGQKGQYHHEFVAYHRHEHFCTYPNCEGILQHTKQEGRSTYYCPAHQV